MNLAVLGATGSIGASTLDVVAAHPGRYRVCALTAHASTDALLELCRVHRPRFAVLSGVAENRVLERQFKDAGSELLFGRAALERVATDAGCDAVMAGIVGAAGLPSTLAAARAGKRVLIANKEALVMAGALVMRAARNSGAQLLPVDSEHNAVFQCFSDKGSVLRIMLTASGGPFLSLPLERLAGVTPEQACAHPNWVMGRKISVDSATMMNKGLDGNVLVRRLEHMTDAAKSIVVWAGVTVAALVHLPASPTPAATALDAGWMSAPLVAGIGVTLIGMSYALQYGLSRMPANRAIVILLFELVVAAAAAHFLAGEALRLRDWVGGALIVAATVASATGRRPPPA